MSDQEKPLPKPPKTPFGWKRSEEETGGQGQLMADQLAMAMAEGKLDEFMRQNMPDNEHARRLAMMMMGMTGMMPPDAFPEAAQDAGQQIPVQAAGTAEGEEVPDDVRQAIMSGNMEELKGLLMREHQKRTGIVIDPLQTAIPGLSTAPAGIEKEMLDQLISIASANSVTLDWLIMRALKVFVTEYQKTGRL